MSLVDEWYNRREDPPQDTAKKILFGLLGNLNSRKGFDYFWGDLDSDIREEILQENLDLIKKNLA